MISEHGALVNAINETASVLHKGEDYVGWCTCRYIIAQTFSHCHLQAMQLHPVCARPALAIKTQLDKTAPRPQMSITRSDSVALYHAQALLLE